jgi:type I restriction enzyme S subunit
MDLQQAQHLIPSGPKLVRITDLKDGQIDWKFVPFCECAEAVKYLLRNDDLLFARTGATTGKTHLVLDPEYAVFASYLIRLRPRVGVSAGYLHAYFQSDNYWSQISDEKEGSAQPNVNGEKLAALTIPLVDSEMQHAIAGFICCVRRRQDGENIELPELPVPLTDQRRVVAQIEELAANIYESRKLRNEVTEELEVLLRSLITNDGSAKPTALRELVKFRTCDVSVRVDEAYQFAGVYCFGRGVFKGNLKSGRDFAYPKLTRLRSGDFVYPKLMAWEGAFGVVPAECDGCVVSTEFPVFEINEDRVFHEVLDTYFRMPSVWPAIAGASTGTNVRRRRLNPSDFLAYEIPLPARETQHTLRSIRREIDLIKPLQAETAAEIDALLPSILDRAFKGEL